jgi:D-arabinose 1-dehydrogenase-like Zn-dependent alcohol dehydrogenase
MKAAVVHDFTHPSATVVAVDLDDDKREVARELGADYVCSTRPILSEEVNEAFDDILHARNKGTRVVRTV